MSDEEVHYWSATPATFRAVRAAAKSDGVAVADWVGQAVVDRLERDAAQQSVCMHGAPSCDDVARHADAAWAARIR